MQQELTDLKPVLIEKSGAVDELMEKDAGDESLRKYKLSLLGNLGDKGDVNDPRKVVVQEFRIMFESKTSEDVVYNLDTEEGVAKMAATPLELKEGCGFKFQLTFRVNHEILTGLSFKNVIRKGIFNTSEKIVIGSYAPQSDPYVFCMPKDGFNYAPSGMMLRGK